MGDRLSSGSSVDVVVGGRGRCRAGKVASFAGASSAWLHLCREHLLRGLPHLLAAPASADLGGTVQCVPGPTQRSIGHRRCGALGTCRQCAVAPARSRRSADALRQSACRSTWSRRRDSLICEMERSPSVASSVTLRVEGSRLGGVPPTRQGWALAIRARPGSAKVDGQAGLSVGLLVDLDDSACMPVGAGPSGDGSFEVHQPVGGEGG